MSLLTGARELATHLHQRCTRLHIFQAALPQPSYLQASYPQAFYFEDLTTRNNWENLVAPQTRERWAYEIQQETAKVPQAQPGMEGMANDEFTALEAEARTRGSQMSRNLDAVVLAMAIERQR